MNLPQTTNVQGGMPVVYRIFEQELQQFGRTGPPREAQLSRVCWKACCSRGAGPWIQ